MPSLSVTKKRKSPAERVDDDVPLKKNAGPTCSIDGCKNKGIGGGICSKHGGKRLCSHEGCGKRVLNRGVCLSHGATANAYRRCSVEGCEKHARTSCEKHARGLGVCVSHGAVVTRCTVDGCNNYKQKGGLCMRHHKEMVFAIQVQGGESISHTTCSIDGCTNKGIGGGICKKHGGKVNYKRCRVEGCDKLAQKGSVCVSHGAITKRCRVDGCGNGAIKGGVCKRHKSQRRDVQLKVATNGQQREECVSSSQSMERIEIVENAAMLNEIIQLYEEECSVDECTIQAQGQGRCVTHGVTCKAKQCKRRGCSTNALYYGFCMRHAPKAFCKVDGCSNIAVTKGCCTRHTMANTVYPMSSNRHKNDKLDQLVCAPITISHEHKEGMNHFAGEKQIPAYQSSHGGCDKWAQQGGCCSVDGCKNKSAGGGICIKHGGKRAPCPKKLCSTAECTHYAIKGGVCNAHGAKRKTCSFESCGNRSQIGGLCFRHGSKMKLKRCRVDGCSTTAKRLGFCFRHGPKVPCSYEGCKNFATVRGCCKNHDSIPNKVCSVASNSSALNNGTAIEKIDMSHPHKNKKLDQLVCIPIDYEHEDKIRHIRPDDYIGLPDPPIMSSDDTSLIGSKQKRSSHLDEEQVCKPHSYTKQAKITTLDYDEDSDEEEELGALIYKYSRTAKMRAEQAQLQKGNANSV